MYWKHIANRKLEAIGFCTYSSKQLQQLSVKELTNPKPFDELGHPASGGLYDPVLGKCMEKGDPFWILVSGII